MLISASSVTIRFTVDSCLATARSTSEGLLANENDVAKTDQKIPMEARKNTDILRKPVLPELLTRNRFDSRVHNPLDRAHSLPLFTSHALPLFTSRGL